MIQYSSIAIGRAILVLQMAAAVWAQNPPVPAGQPASQPAKQEAARDRAVAADLNAPVDPKTFIIGAEDVLGIRVWREPELSASVIVRPDGRISLPLAGEIEAGGLTPEQLGVKVAEALSKFLNRPEVSVSVQSVQSRKFCILGKVNRTGCFPLVTPVTVLDALTLTGGLQDFADQKGIVIARGKQRFIFNYKDVIKGKKLEQNIPLQPGDYIIVK